VSQFATSSFFVTFSADWKYFTPWEVPLLGLSCLAVINSLRNELHELFSWGQTRFRHIKKSFTITTDTKYFYELTCRYQVSNIQSKNASNTVTVAYKLDIGIHTSTLCLREYHTVLSFPTRTNFGNFCINVADKKRNNMLYFSTSYNYFFCTIWWKMKFTAAAQN